MHCNAPLALHSKQWSHSHGFTHAGGENCSMLPPIITSLPCTTYCLTFCCPGMTAACTLKYLNCLMSAMQLYILHIPCSLIGLLTIPEGLSPVIVSQYIHVATCSWLLVLNISTLEDDDTVALKYGDKMAQWHSIMSWEWYQFYVWHGLFVHLKI